MQIRVSALCVVSVKGGWGVLELGGGCCVLGMPGAFFIQLLCYYLISLTLLNDWFQQIDFFVLPKLLVFTLAN